MNDQNMAVLTNIIGAVESGGQVYGKRRYDAYAAPYTNSNVEHTVTLGWAQNYGSEAKKLIQMIREKDRQTFDTIDTVGSVAAMLSQDWVAIRWKPTTSQKKILISLIDSKAGHECQDELFASLMKTFIAECEKNYTKQIPAVMMYCEIRHLGGVGPVKRIFDRLGGKYDLDSIMASLVKDQRDKSNDNQVGDTKFWTRHLKCKEFIERYAVEETAEEKREETKVAVHYISNSGGDENGSIAGGKAGDQTGKEWQLRAWYNRPWSCVLRHPDATVRQYHADMAEAAAKNDLIGYDQGQRDTFGVQLKAAGDDPAKIKVACEADCSKGVIDITKAIGRKTGRKELQNIQATYTGNMRAAYKAAGYQVLTDSKYLTSPDYLLPGDILLNDEHHTATNITKGSKADGSSTQATPAASSYIVGSGTVVVKHFLVGAVDPQVKTIQRILNALGYKGKDGKKLSVDGDLGENTSYAIAAFQKAVGMNPDNPGTVATKTWEKLLNAE